MSDGDTGSGSDQDQGASQNGRSVGIGSDLFKAVLNDYFLEESTRISKVEYDRYQAKKEQKKDDVDHVTSEVCESCQCVLALCKCNVYDGADVKYGQKVHWADEVWKRPLAYITVFDDDSPVQTVDESTKMSKTARHPKPILKHKATCIIIVSE